MAGPTFGHRTLIQASTDSSFFSGKATKLTTTRVRTVTRMQPFPSPPTRPASASLSPLSTLSASPSPPVPKRKASGAVSEPKRRKVHEPVKRKPRKQADSRHSSRSARSPSPVYRISASKRHKEVYQPQERDWAALPSDGPDPYRHTCSSFAVVKSLLKKYQPYFHDPANPSSSLFTMNIHHPPTVTIQYPARGASESFILAAPKDKDHYNPFFDLEKTIYTIVDHYVPDQFKHMFGDVPNTDGDDDDDDEDDNDDYHLDQSVSPPPGAYSSSAESFSLSSPSRFSTPDFASIPQSSSPPSSICGSDLLPPVEICPALSRSSSYSSFKRPQSPPKSNLLRSVARAIHLRDGPALIKAVNDVNELIEDIREPCLPLDRSKKTMWFEEAVASWRTKGLPKPVLMRILEENYQRCVGPHVLKLKQYPAFSSSVYGELMPDLVHEILVKTKVKQESLFLDLGSGVGNVVVQAALQTGCRSFGIELNEAPAKVAADMVGPFKARCRMWGVRCGEIEVVKGDMLVHPRVDELMKTADVVLVDNKVFDQRLNEALKPKFLDLKEGAMVVSLKPFVSSINGRLTERNLDDMATIFEVTEHEYHSGSVSWGNGGGHYYIHRVDRTGYAQFRTQFENQRRSRRR